ncbi:MAG: SDR family NAD(P)-dependent oxidoreductase [Planctomycetota bacterium]|jgi:NAD(P)-dependent dehydrogenase (short-subunit alcohol dehydrogenase family)
MEIDLSGEVALVTGASIGIGRAVAEAIGSAGATTAVHFRSHPGEADEVVKALPKAKAFRADLGNADEVRALHEQVVKALGPVTILVNNAGIWEGSPAGSADAMEKYRRLMAVNLEASYHLSNLVVPAMKERKSGVILNVSSRAAKRGEERSAHYAISKGGMNAMTVSLARELAPHGIRVNCVAPGWIETPMTAEHLKDSAVRKEMEDQTLLRRVGTAEDIAGAALFLVSRNAAYVTGQILHINGGSYLNA